MSTICDYAEFVRSRAKPMPTKVECLLHAAVGLVGELIELRAAESRLDSVNQLEEVGDALFYIQMVENDLGALPDVYVEGGTDGLAIAGDFLDLCKKAWVYNKPLETLEAHMKLYVAQVRRLLEGYCMMTLQTSLSVAINENVEKLMRRYPVGYSDQAAQARADKPEGR